MKSKMTSPLFTSKGFLLLSSCLLISSPALADEGEQLFQKHCSRCHATARNITASAEKIIAVLRSERVRQHRFSLDDQTIQNIVDFIRQQP